MSRRRRRDRTSTGDVVSVALELSDLLWGVLAFVVRLPLMLLRLLG